MEQHNQPTESEHSTPSQHSAPHQGHASGIPGSYGQNQGPMMQQMFPPHQHQPNPQMSHQPQQPMHQRHDYMMQNDQGQFHHHVAQANDGQNNYVARSQYYMPHPSQGGQYPAQGFPPGYYHPQTIQPSNALMLAPPHPSGQPQQLAIYQPAPQQQLMLTAGGTPTPNQQVQPKRRSASVKPRAYTIEKYLGPKCQPNDQKQFQTSFENYLKQFGRSIRVADDVLCQDPDVDIKNVVRYTVAHKHGIQQQNYKIDHQRAQGIIFVNGMTAYAQEAGLLTQYKNRFNINNRYLKKHFEDPNIAAPWHNTTSACGTNDTSTFNNLRFRKHVQTPQTAIVLAVNSRMPESFFRYYMQKPITKCPTCNIVMQKEHGLHYLDQNQTIMISMDELADFSTDADAVGYDYCSNLHERFNNPDFNPLNKIHPPLAHHPSYQAVMNKSSNNLSPQEVVDDCQMLHTLCIAAIICKLHPGKTPDEIGDDELKQSMIDLLKELIDIEKGVLNQIGLKWGIELCPKSIGVYEGLLDELVNEDDSFTYSVFSEMKEIIGTFKATKDADTQENRDRYVCGHSLKHVRLEACMSSENVSGGLKSKVKGQQISRLLANNLFSALMEKKQASTIQPDEEYPLLLARSKLLDHKMKTHFHPHKVEEEYPNVLDSINFPQTDELELGFRDCADWGKDMEIQIQNLEKAEDAPYKPIKFQPQNYRLYCFEPDYEIKDVSTGFFMKIYKSYGKQTVEEIIQHIKDYQSKFLKLTSAGYRSSQVPSRATSPVPVLIGQPTLQQVLPSQAAPKKQSGKTVTAKKQAVKQTAVAQQKQQAVKNSPAPNQSSKKVSSTKSKQQDKKVNFQLKHNQIDQNLSKELKQQFEAKSGSGSNNNNSSSSSSSAQNGSGQTSKSDATGQDEGSSASVEVTEKEKALKTEPRNTPKRAATKNAQVTERSPKLQQQTLKFVSKEQDQAKQRADRQRKRQAQTDTEKQSPQAKPPSKKQKTDSMTPPTARGGTKKGKGGPAGQENEGGQPSQSTKAADVSGVIDKILKKTEKDIKVADEVRKNLENANAACEKKKKAATHRGVDSPMGPKLEEQSQEKSTKGKVKVNNTQTDKSDDKSQEQQDQDTGAASNAQEAGEDETPELDESKAQDTNEAGNEEQQEENEEQQDENEEQHDEDKQEEDQQEQPEDAQEGDTQANAKNQQAQAEAAQNQEE